MVSKFIKLAAAGITALNMTGCSTTSHTPVEPEVAFNSPIHQQFQKQRNELDAKISDVRDIIKDGITPSETDILRESFSQIYKETGQLRKGLEAQFNNFDKPNGIDIQSYNRYIKTTHYITKETSKKLTESLKDLLPEYDKPEEKLISPTKNLDNFLSDLLDKNHGAALLDVHSEGMTFSYTQKNIKSLSDANVKTVFIELPVNDTDRILSTGQDIFEAYQSAVAGGAQEKFLAEKITDLIRRTTVLDYPETFMSMLASAKEYDIEIKPIDIDPNRDINLGMQGRIEETDYVWSRNIIEHQATKSVNDKFIVIGGSNHFGEHSNKNIKHIGHVDDILNIPSINFEVGEKLNIEKSNSEQQDYTVTMPPIAKKHVVEENRGFNR